MTGHRNGPSTGAASTIQGRAGHDQNTSDLLSVADGFRAALALAGIDRTSLGIRDRGPLDWMPADVPAEGPPEPPVAVARRAVIAHERRVELDQTLTLARRFIAEFGGAV